MDQYIIVSADHTSVSKVKDPLLSRCFRQVNGHIEIRLVNLGFKTTNSRETRRLIATSDCQEYVEPEILRRLLRDEPSRYIACSLRISQERTAYAEVQDTVTPDIQVLTSFSNK